MRAATAMPPRNAIFFLIASGKVEFTSVIATAAVMQSSTVGPTASRCF